ECAPHLSTQAALSLGCAARSIPSVVDSWCTGEMIATTAGGGGVRCAPCASKRKLELRAM
ncbi:MAG: hypothetical protein ABIP53_08575, partial [Candidatus Limnocylindrales bacterium]